MKLKLILLTSLLLMSCSHVGTKQTGKVPNDPYLWLEEIKSQRALAWVNEQDIKAVEKLNTEHFRQVKNELLKIYNDKDTIPMVKFEGKFVYNFWTDEKNKKGLLRRTTFSSYKRENPKWEIVLDVDELGRQEGTNWVYKGIKCFPPEFVHCMISLSEGGQDAEVQREFDLNKKDFVKDGFNLSASKGYFDWYDLDHILVNRNFGPNTITKTGYPRQVRFLSRGQTSEQAKIIDEVPFDYNSIWQTIYRGPTFSPKLVVDYGIEFYKHVKWYYSFDMKNKTKIPLPLDAAVLGFFDKWMIVSTQSPMEVNGETLKEGSIISLEFEPFIQGSKKYLSQVLFSPTERQTYQNFQFGKNAIYLVWSDEVKNRLTQFKYKNKKFIGKVINLPDGVITAEANPYEEKAFVTFNNSTTPTTLFYLDKYSQLHTLKKSKQYFDATNVEVRQWHAQSKDGTDIPYFVVGPKNLKLNGTNRTIMDGYGGFKYLMQPRYYASDGKAWLEKGNVYVITNIRGGGEFGPKWYEAALKNNRHKGFEDFIAIAEDLIKRKVTSPEYLGIKGASNGGYLVGAVMNMRPELFAAVSAVVPLMDMIRFADLPPGAFWTSEYGDPKDPVMYDYLLKHSPYHNIKKGIKYPTMFLYTSTMDDRVQPGHPRKMAARMMEYGHQVIYYENTQGGHGVSADKEQMAERVAMEFEFFDQYLKK